MGLNASSSGGSFEKAPVGVHVARCYRVIDLGTQETNWQGQAKKAHKCLIGWELLGDARMSDGRPFSVSQRYTVSLHPKSQLRQHLEAWRGRPFTPEEEARFDLSKVLGAYCLLNIVHDGEYANIASIMPLVAGMAKPDPVNAEFSFDLDNPDMHTFNTFSDGLKATIQKSPEWKASQGQGNHSPAFDPADDVF